MGIARSTYYAEAATKAADAGIVAEMKAICDEFEAYQPVEKGAIDRVSPHGET